MIWSKVLVVRGCCISNLDFISLLLINGNDRQSLAVSGWRGKIGKG